MWALVTVKGGTPFVEDIEKSPNVNSWGLPLFVAVDVPIARVGKECDWPKTPENFRRLEFCRKYEGYGSLCHCSKPLPLYVPPTDSVKPNHIADIPVAVIASNRPTYLFRMLRRLLSTPGSNPQNTVVYIDGFFPEVVNVAELVGVRAIQVRGGVRAIQLRGGVRAIQVRGGVRATQARGGVRAIQVGGGVRAIQLRGGVRAIQVRGGVSAIQVRGGVRAIQVRGGV